MAQDVSECREEPPDVALTQAFDAIRDAARAAVDRGVRAVTLPEMERERNAFNELRALTGTTLTDEQKIERDRLIYGNGYGRRRADGSMEHIPAQDVVTSYQERTSVTWGDAVATAAIVATAATDEALQSLSDRMFDATQRPLRRFQHVAIVDNQPNPEWRVRLESVRPDGFSQSKIDQIKAMLTTKGGR